MCDWKGIVAKSKFKDNGDKHTTTLVEVSGYDAEGNPEAATNATTQTTLTATAQSLNARQLFFARHSRWFSHRVRVAPVLVEFQDGFEYEFKWVRQD